MKYVAFLRAINVGGRGILKMTELRDIFNAAGAVNVSTYIQTGNVIFETPAGNKANLIKELRVRLTAVLTNEPGIVLRSARELNDIVAAAPFKRLEHDASIKLYVAFFSERLNIKPKLPVRSVKEALEVVGVREREAFVVSRRKANGFYGFPNNFVEAEFGVEATTRNWSTVIKIAELMTA